MNNDKGTVPVELLVTRYFVKYNRLDQLIPQAFKGSGENTINLYIDLYGLYKTIFSRSFRTDISDYTALIPAIVNMCAHYRGYFKAIGVYANIYLISSYNVTEINRKFVAEYNKTMMEKLGTSSIREMVELNLELLELLCKYLPNIYYISTNFESSALMKYLIDKNPDIPNLIISSDIYPIQLTSEYDNTVFLRPRKYNGKDLSTIVFPRNKPQEHFVSFWSLITGEREKLSLEQSSITVHTSNFAILEALNRFPERNLKSLMNITTANNTLMDVMGWKNEITPQILFSMNKELELHVPKVLVEARYKVLNLDYQLNIFSNSIEPSLINLQNLNDPDAVNLINDRYFKNNPIDLSKI